MTVLGLSVSSILLLAIAVGMVWIYVPYIVVAFARMQVGYSKEMLSAPRATLDQLPDYGQRAMWAHQNTLEAFPIFAAAALMAYVTQVTSPAAGWAAIVWMATRLLYPVFYILNIPPLRALMFATGSICSFTLVGLSLINAI